MECSAIRELLLELEGPARGNAWIEFLNHFSPVLQQVIVFSLDDSDAQADCFVYVCEKLAENHFRRLRKFHREGRASFPTWLRVVVRNLCMDWARRNYGRNQPFAWTRSLPSLDQEVFRCVYEHRYTVRQTYLRLLTSTQPITEDEVEASATRLATRLSIRERWLLSSRSPRIASLDAVDESGRELCEIRDLAPDPEHSAIDKENRHAMGTAMQKLPTSEQLLLRMRFDQDLTLQEIARVAGFKDAQSADRKIRSVLDRMRGEMTRSLARLPGKAKAASV